MFKWSKKYYFLWYKVEKNVFKIKKINDVPQNLFNLKCNFMSIKVNNASKWRKNKVNQTLIN